MMQITDMMVDRIRQAIPKLEADNAVEIPEMGGYFVTRVGNEIPEHARRIIELGVDGEKILVYTVVEEA